MNAPGFFVVGIGTLAIGLLKFNTACAITFVEEEQQWLYSPVTETIAAMMGIDIEAKSNLRQDDIFDPIRQNFEHKMEEIDSI